MTWTVVDCALWRWITSETSRLLQRRNSTKPLCGWDCREMLNYATLTWDYVRLLNSKWWDQILLKFEMNNDWTSQIFRWSVAMNQFWINGKATVEFCGRSHLLVVANWPRGGRNCHCNVGSPGEISFPSLHSTGRLLKTRVSFTTSQVNNLGSHVRWMSSLYPLVI